MIHLRRFFLLLIIVLNISVCAAQEIEISGQILDASTSESLVFANIYNPTSGTGTTTDFDGFFTTKCTIGKTLIVSYIGFEDQEIKVTGDRFLTILLEPNAATLATIVVRPEENPALRIIQAAIDHRAENDPSRITGYHYTAFHKTVLQMDTTVDNRPVAKKQPKKIMKPEKVRRDSIRQAVFQNDMHLWLTESLTENWFLAPNRKKEHIIARKSSMPNDITAGLNPVDFQPFGFYEPFIRLDFAGQEYINPISDGTFSRYDFVLADTLFRDTDTTFVITFQPKNRRNFSGLKGLLYIHTDGYAIENVIAEPADTNQSVQFQLQQKSERVEGHWFPTKLQTDLFFQISLGAVYSNYSFRNRSEIYEISLEAPAASVFNHYYRENTYQVNEEEVDWDSLRTLPLDRREENTYVWWDSLPELRAPFKLLKAYNGLIKTMGTGLWEIGAMDVVIPDLLRSNNFEGTRLGLGLKTNPSFGKWGYVYGYAGYGFKDKKWKYGGDLALNLYQHRDIKLQFSYQQDVIEPANIYYLSYINNPWLGLNTATIARSRMDYVEEYRIDGFYRPTGTLLLNPFWAIEQRTLTYDYQYESPNIYPDKGNELVSTGIRLRFAPREQLIKIDRLEALLKPVFPVFDLVISQNELSAQGLSFWSISGQVEQELLIKSLGKTRFLLQVGTIKGSGVPYPYLFQGPGLQSENSQDVYTENYFQTMGQYEFLSDRYVYLFFEHSFDRLLGRPKTRFSQPELSLVQHVGWGSLDNPTKHEGLEFKTLEDGFLESGIRVDNILRIPYFNAFYFGLGGGFFYRWGANRFPVDKDNWGFQFSLRISV